MNLEAFRTRVRQLCRPTGFSQKMLAYQLGLQPTALSNKLNGTGETSLKHTEVKQIIKILAEWEAITTQAEAVELLEMIGLNQSSFPVEEWNKPPLNKLALPTIEDKGSSVFHKREERHVPGLAQNKESKPFSLSHPTLSQSQTASSRSNFPAQPTSFIGREKEINALTNILRRKEVRLLTLTGPGGVGKTRLALQVVEELLSDFGDGIFLVWLATINDPSLVLSTIARTLGIQERGSQSLDQEVKSYLWDKQVLLVLDNFEQVLAASGVVKDLMAELPYLKLLVTSRALLRLYGEHEYNLSPMALPDLSQLPPSQPLPLEKLAGYEGVALFIQRAQAAKPGFTLTGSNAPVLVEICRKLDGLPLAIELAAARIKLLSPSQILARLDHRLDLLSRGPQDLPARQQTLRALIDWSYNLLAAAEQALLTRLAIFVGGCDLEAVAAVDGDKGEGSNDTPADLLDRLSSLLEKSMLKISESESSGPRFSLMETIREYALEKLAVRGEEQTLRERYALYFLDLAGQAETFNGTNQQKSWLDRLEREHDNLRAVLAWAIERQHATLLTGAGEEGKGFSTQAADNPSLSPSYVEIALELCNHLAWFWDAHGHLTEGRRWLEQTLGLLPQTEEPTPETGPINSNLITQSLKMQAKALNAAGNLAYKQNDTAQATAFLERSLALRRQLGHPREIAQTLNNLGVLAFHQGDFERARKLYEESLAIKNRLGDKRSIGLALNNLAEVIYEQGDEEQAIALYEESLARLKDTGDTQNLAAVLLNLGVATGAKGNYKRANELLRESLKILGKLADKFHIAEILERLAFLAKETGQLEHAASLLGAAHSLRLAINAPGSQSYLTHYDALLQTIKAQLEPGNWARAWSFGESMPYEQIVDFALTGE